MRTGTATIEIKASQQQVWDALTERFSYEPQGFMGFVYEKLLARSRMMTKGMERTLARVKEKLESTDAPK